MAIQTFMDKITGKVCQKQIETDATAGDDTKFLNECGEFSTPLNMIRLAACSGLGYAITGSGPAFTWVDPDNVVLNGSDLAEWNQTVLVRKQGENFPTGPADGTILATTSAELGNKNYYRNNNFIDETQAEGATYCYMLFSQTKAGVWNCLDANKYTSGVGLSWGQIQQYVRAGRGADLFPIGTVFYVDHPEYTHTDGTGLWFRVVGHDQVPANDENLTHTMCLEMIDVLFAASYDANEPIYTLTPDTTAQAGKSYYVNNNGSYTKLIEGTDYEVGDTIPIAAWYEKNLDGRNNGSNNAAQSNMIQWANATAAANQWFTAQTLWDVCSSGLLNKNGFMRHLDPLFAAAVQPAKLTTAKCTAEGGGSIIHSAKFWPLSMTQVYGSANNGVTENTQLKFYADGGSKIKYAKDTETATTWLLRSPLTGVTYYVYYVQASGASATSNASHAYGFSLACIIA